MKQPTKAPPTPPCEVRAGLDVGARELVVAILREGQPEAACTLPNMPAGLKAKPWVAHAGLDPRTFVKFDIKEVGDVSTAVLELNRKGGGSVPTAP